MALMVYCSPLKFEITSSELSLLVDPCICISVIDGQVHCDQSGVEGGCRSVLIYTVPLFSLLWSTTKRNGEWMSTGIGIGGGQDPG